MPGPIMLPHQGQPEISNAPNQNQISNLEPITTKVELKKPIPLKTEPEVISVDDEEDKSNNESSHHKQVRWKKQDDMRLFAYLEQYCHEKNTTIPDLIEKADHTEETDHFWATTAKKVKWVGTYIAL